jgi:hypothetical protein
MNISRSHANRLVREGRATLDGATYDIGGQRYQIVIRHDIDRVDHYRLRNGQPVKVAVKGNPPSSSGWTGFPPAPKRKWKL